MNTARSPSTPSPTGCLYPTAEGQTMTGWISVDDRLPAVDDHVLAWFHYGGLSNHGVAYVDEVGDWHEVHGDGSVAADADPEYWMPLPDHPE